MRMRCPQRPQALDIAVIPMEKVRAICSESCQESETHESIHGCVAETLGLSPEVCHLPQ